MTVTTPTLKRQIVPEGGLRYRTTERQRSVVNAVAMVTVDALASFTAGCIVFGGGHRWLEYSLVFVFFWIFGSLQAGLYPGYGVDSPDRLRLTLVIGGLLGTAALVLLGDAGTSPPRVAAGVAVAVVSSNLGRGLVRWVLTRRALWGVPAVVIGTGPSADCVRQTLLERPDLGYLPLRPDDAGEGVRPAVAFLVTSEPASMDLSMLAAKGPEGYARVFLVMGAPSLLVGWAGLRSFGSFQALQFRRAAPAWPYLGVKRTLDLTFSVLCAILVLPLLGAIALAVRLDSDGPIFHSAARLGRGGRLFQCLKFRTMRIDAETALASLLARDPSIAEEYAHYHKLRFDPRVTRIGRLLRKTSLDELPQFLNVLRGEMSLVGPRPYLPRERRDMGILAETILTHTPGITGYWQVNGRGRSSFAERLQMDVQYVNHWSLWLDVYLLMRTVPTVLLGHSAY